MVYGDTHADNPAIPEGFYDIGDGATASPFGFSYDPETQMCYEDFLAPNGPRAVTAPKSGAPSAILSSYEGSINYTATGVLLTYGRFEGQVTSAANSKESFLVTGALYGIGFQFGTIEGTSNIVLRQDPNNLIGVGNGGFFTNTVSVSAGVFSFGSVSQTVFMNSGTQENLIRIDFERPQFQLPSDTKPTNPKDILSIKPGIGLSFGFHGIVIEEVVPIFIPPPKG